MGFKDNLLKKIDIEQLVEHMTANVTPGVDESEFDKDSARRLIRMGGFIHVQLDDSDSEPYILGKDGDKKIIMALDSELAIYEIAIDDAALYENPNGNKMAHLRCDGKLPVDGTALVSKRIDSNLPSRKC